MFRCECQGEAGRSVANNGGGRPRKGGTLEGVSLQPGEGRE